MQCANNIFQDEQNLINDNFSLYHMMRHMSETEQYKFWDNKRKPVDGATFDDFQINVV